MQSKKLEQEATVIRFRNNTPGEIQAVEFLQRRRIASIWNSLLDQMAWAKTVWWVQGWHRCYPISDTQQIYLGDWASLRSNNSIFLALGFEKMIVYCALGQQWNWVGICGLPNIPIALESHKAANPIKLKHTNKHLNMAFWPP